MDLLERGRSLSELGRTLRWSDLAAFLDLCPAGSYTARALDPENSRLTLLIDELSSPRGRLIAMMHDSLEATLLALGHAKPPDQGLMARIVQAEMQRTETAEESAEQASRPRSKRMSSAEIRAQIKANEER